MTFLISRSSINSTAFPFVYRLVQVVKPLGQPGYQAPGPQEIGRMGWGARWEEGMGCSLESGEGEIGQSTGGEEGGRRKRLPGKSIIS